MRFLILCIFIIFNASNDGKASLESFMPNNDNILLTDTTKNTGKFCLDCMYSLFPAYSGVGRGNLVLRLSGTPFPTFRRMRHCVFGDKTRIYSPK